MTHVLERIVMWRARAQGTDSKGSEGGSASLPSLDAPARGGFVGLTIGAVFLLLCIAFAGGTAISTRAAARDLDALRGELDRLRAQERHLEVERSLLRDHARLEEVAMQQGLAPPARVVHLDGQTPAGGQ
jgi:cell division protein FtsL